MSCLPDLPPTNPISSLILSSLGKNFFPPFDAHFMPSSRGNLVDEKWLKMLLPGGGKLKPIGDPKHVHISEYLTPLTGLLGSALAFFGPLFIILDVIRALIDIICSLFNPVPLILSVVDLFLNVIPPLIALYPPLSSILLAINVIKLLVTIVGSIAASLIPIIADIVDNALEVPGKLSMGNIRAVDNVEIKLCELFQEFANVLAGFGPIKFILELIEIFMNLGAKFFCIGSIPGQPGSPCCTTENCPPVIINVPSGQMQVLHTVNSFTLQDMLNTIFDLINIPLDLLTKALKPILDQIVGFINELINGIKSGIESLIAPLNDVLALVAGLVAQPATLLPSLTLPSVNFEVPAFDLKLPVPTGFDEVVFIEPLMTLQYKTAVSKVNDSGLVSAVGVGHKFSGDELAGLQNFIIDPNKVPSPGPKTPPGLGKSDEEKESTATIQVRLTDPSPGGKSVLTDAIFEYPTVQTIARNLGISTQQLTGVLNIVGLDFLPTNYLGVIQVRDDTFPAGTELEYEIVPNYIELLKQNLIGLGCYPDIQLAAQATAALTNADVGASFATGGGTSGFDPLVKKIGGRTIPPPPIDTLGEIFDELQADPTVPVDPLPILNDYLDDLAEVYDSIICVGASSIQSLFEVSKSNVLANGKDKTVLSVRIKDSGGNDLLVGGQIPGSTFRVQFEATKGTVGPVLFDEDTGTFSAAYTSSEVGEAEITASFIVREKVCTRLSTFQDFPAPGQLNVRQKIITVNFVPERTAYPKTRKQGQYVQSRGGRVRR